MHKDPIDFAAFLRNASRETWPRYPICPLMSRDGEMTEGLVRSDVAKRPVVYLGNFIIVVLSAANHETWEQALNKLKQKVYPTLEALVAEWRVD